MPALVEIEFHPGFPERLKKETSDLLTPLLGLVGRDIATLRVAMMDAGGMEGAVACIQVLRQYHQAALWLSGEWFTYDAARQRKTIIHEFGHVLFDVMTREIQRIINCHVADDAAKKYLSELLDEAEDRAVDALALAWDVRDLQSNTPPVDALEPT